MKKIAFLLFMLMMSKIGIAQYRPADLGSLIKFKIENFGFDVSGTFNGLAGNINFDPNNPADAQFDVTIDANTVSTGNGMRDGHLRGEDYFDVKNFPRIRLVSKKVSSANKNGSYLLTAQLTIKGKSKDISFPFSATQSGDGLVFNGTFKIKRKDFGIGGASTISDELEVSLNVIAKKL